jgi:hypothetical protein
VSLNALLVVHRWCLGTIASLGNASALDLFAEEQPKLFVVDP